MKKLVIIDNYDSFTYNLVHAVEELLGHEITVIKNDQVDLDALDSFEYFILSPGPGLPKSSGDLLKVIHRYRGTKKILGVCLGLQAIAESYGCKLKNLDSVFHGIRDEMIQTEEKSKLFDGLGPKFWAGRYHSWVIESSSLPHELKITSVDKEGEIMSIEHSSDRVFAVQFHPESIMTDEGKVILKNFLEKA